MKRQAVVAFGAILVVGLAVGCVIQQPSTTAPTGGTSTSNPSSGSVGGGGGSSGGGVTVPTNPNTDLVGYWTLYSFSATDGVKTIQINYPLASLNFAANGTGTCYYYTSNGSLTSDSFTWQRSGNSVYVSYQTLGSDTFVLSGNSLTVIGYTTSGGKTITLTAIFKK